MHGCFTMGDVFMDSGLDVFGVEIGVVLLGCCLLPLDFLCGNELFFVAFGLTLSGVDLVPIILWSPFTLKQCIRHLFTSQVHSM